jgi:hypothetical protein
LTQHLITIKSDIKYYIKQRDLHTGYVLRKNEPLSL